MENILEIVDSSFKYIFLGFNLITLLVVYLYQRTKKTKKEHHILFVIAHPDDQSMFFGPTIADLTRDYFVHLLCMSLANSDRANQLQQSVKYLRIHQYKCLNNDKLVDGLKEKWCEQTIFNEVKTYVQENGIKAIFTFDERGVSNHPNHQAIYRALSSHESEEPKKQTFKQVTNANPAAEETNPKPNESPSPKPMKIYYLQSTNIIRKYIGPLAIVIGLLRQFSYFKLNYIHAWKSLRIHKTQFVWYRKLWIIFSRYTYLNTYQRRWVSLN